MTGALPADLPNNGGEEGSDKLGGESQVPRQSIIRELGPARVWFISAGSAAVSTLESSAKGVLSPRE